MRLTRLAACLLGALALSMTAHGGIYRHREYTLYPMKVDGRTSPLKQLAQYQPVRTAGSAAGGKTGDGHLLTEQELAAAKAAAEAAERAAEAAIQHATDDPDNGQTLFAGLAHELEYLLSNDYKNKKLPMDYVPITPLDSSITVDPDDTVPSAAETTKSKADVSVRKLNLWLAFPEASHDAQVQKGHFIRLENAHRHFSFFPPKGGCESTEKQGGREKASENSRRNKCRVATNAGFFNTDPGIKSCYNAMIVRDGEFIQTQHTRYVSRQFKKNVHFGLTSHAHFFIGYPSHDPAWWARHLKPGSMLPTDIDDTRPSRRSMRTQSVVDESSEDAIEEDEPTVTTGIDATSGHGYTVTTLSKAALATRARRRRLLQSRARTLQPGEHMVDPPSTEPMTYVDITTNVTRGDWYFTTLLGGVVWLVRDGREYIAQSLADGEDMTVEKTDCPDNECGAGQGKVPSAKRSEHFVHLKAARTGIGHTTDGALVIVSIDGASSHDDVSQQPGINLHDLAALLISFGVVNGMNLDGGGSATVVVDHVVSNFPSDPMLPGHVNDVSIYNGQPWSTIASSERTVGSIACIYDDTDGEPLAPTFVDEIHVRLNATNNDAMAALIQAAAAMSGQATAYAELQAHASAIETGASTTLLELQVVTALLFFLALAFLTYVCCHRCGAAQSSSLYDHAIFSPTTPPALAQQRRRTKKGGFEMLDHMPDAELAHSPPVANVDLAAAAGAVDSEEEEADQSTLGVARAATFFAHHVDGVALSADGEALDLPPPTAMVHELRKAAASLDARVDLSLNRDAPALSPPPRGVTLPAATSRTLASAQRAQAKDRQRLARDRATRKDLDSTGSLLDQDAADEADESPPQASRSPATARPQYELGDDIDLPDDDQPNVP